MRHWTPLLDGELLDRARAAIEQIAETLRASAQRVAFDAADREPAPLASGTSGAALFFAYKSFVDDSQNDADLAAELMAASAEALADVAMPPSLYQGFSGVAWAQSHLTGRLFEAADAEADANAEINDALTEYVVRTGGRGDYDLITGLVGFGVYALEQAKEPRTDPLVAAVVTAIDELAESTPAGRAWRTPPALLLESTAARHPEGVFDLGVAHGVGGIIGLLSAVSAAGKSQVDPLLDAAVQWLLGQQMDDAGVSVFPAWISPGRPVEQTRLAWCYGDLGLAVVLLAAARARHRAALADEALRIARMAAARPDALTHVSDTGLCHGSAGVGHLFNRLYQATGEAWLGDAARRWFARVLADRRDGHGVAGWSAVNIRAEGREERYPDAGFLMGATGIGLALLAAASHVEPEWDRVLLTAIPEPVRESEATTPT